MDRAPGGPPRSGSAPDDLGLLRAARDGDHEAGAALVRRHGASMMRTVWSVAGRSGGNEAEDVVQEAFIAALTTPALPHGDVGAWLRAIAARKALDGLRQASRRGETSLAAAGERPTEQVSPARDAPRLEVLVVRRALARLDPRDRAVLTLVDVEGFSMLEAARALGSTTMATKWRAVRARRRLRALLEAGTAKGE